MEKKKKNIWLNLIVVALIFIIMLVIILVNNDAKDIFSAIKEADYKYILIALGFILIFILFTAFSLMQLVSLKKKINIFDSFNIANLPNFYNGITPFASGGQPFQVYYYTKVNVKTDESTSVIMMNFIIHQFVLCVFGIAAIIMYYKDLVANQNTAFRVAVWIGLSINVFIFLLLIFISLSKHVKKVFMGLVGLIFSIKFLRKKKDDMIEKTNNYFDESQKSFKELFHHIPTLLLSIMYKVISLIAYFIVPYFIFKALHIEVKASNIVFIIWMTAFAYVIMSFMPTPGSSGGAEWAFSEVFSKNFVLSGAKTASAILIWRFFTYYLVMILGAISAICVKRRKVDEDKCELESSQTVTSHKSME